MRREHGVEEFLWSQGTIGSASAITIVSCWLFILVGHTPTTPNKCTLKNPALILPNLTSHDSIHTRSPNSIFYEPAIGRGEKSATPTVKSVRCTQTHTQRAHAVSLYMDS